MLLGLNLEFVLLCLASNTGVFTLEQFKGGGYIPPATLLSLPPVKPGQALV